MKCEEFAQLIESALLELDTEDVDPVAAMIRLSRLAGYDPSLRHERGPLVFINFEVKGILIDEWKDVLRRSNPLLQPIISSAPVTEEGSVSLWLLNPPIHESQNQALKGYELGRWRRGLHSGDSENWYHHDDLGRDVEVCPNEANFKTERRVAMVLKSWLHFCRSDRWFEAGLGYSKQKFEDIERRLREFVSENSDTKGTHRDRARQFAGTISPEDWADYKRWHQHKKPRNPINKSIGDFFYHRIAKNRI